jgi:hypothetical protein
MGSQLYFIKAIKNTCACRRKFETLLCSLLLRSRRPAIQTVVSHSVNFALVRQTDLWSCATERWSPRRALPVQERHLGAGQRINSTTAAICQREDKPIITALFAHVHFQYLSGASRLPTLWRPVPASSHVAVNGESINTMKVHTYSRRRSEGDGGVSASDDLLKR